MFLYFVCLFFFKQKTAYEMRISDWSSDVCSSDLFNRMLDDISREHTQTQGSQSVGVALNELLRAHEATQPLSDMEKRLIRWHITNQEYSTGDRKSVV